MPADYKKIFIALVALIGLSVLFLTINANGNWSFVLSLRSKKLLALILVAYSIGVSTLLFQTLTNNPILTPSLLGFDTLYVFLQTVLVLIFGSIGFTQINPAVKFSFEILLMLGAAIFLFQILLKQGGKDIARMILIGVIFGILFRSLTGLMQRLIDPEEFALVQSVSYASFNSFNENQLWLSAGIMIISVGIIWRERFKLDVHLLGREQVINLGINHKIHTLWILSIIAVLVATATALVGPFSYPVSFFGLLVCAMTNHIIKNAKHNQRLPMAFLIAGIMLIGGQIIFEQVFGMKAVLSVAVEFAGGLVFLYLVLKKRQK